MPPSQEYLDTMARLEKEAADLAHDRKITAVASVLSVGLFMIGSMLAMLGVFS